MDENKDPSYGHELQWMKFETEWYGLSVKQDDVWDRRAMACTRLLQRFC